MIHIIELYIGDSFFPYNLVTQKLFTGTISEIVIIILQNRTCRIMQTPRNL